MKQVYIVSVVVLFVTFLFPSFQRVEAVENSTDGMILLIIDEKYSNTISSHLDTFEQDIRQDLLVSVERYIINPSNTTPLEIRNYIKSLYTPNKLLGAILIGDIPTAFIENYSLPTDMFYEDLPDFPN